MPGFMTSPSFIWFIIGFVFVLAELGAPGFIILFFGFGAWTAAIASWLFGVGTDMQIVIFLVSSILFLVALRRIWMRIFMGTSSGNESELSDQPSNVGAVVEVVQAVSASAPGEIKYRGTFWRAISDASLEVGALAIIVDEFTEDHSTFKIGPYNG